MANAEDVSMFIFVNSTLQMTKGKIAAQVGHVVQQIIEKSASKVIHDRAYHKRYFDWKRNGSKKIVLKATEDDLKNFIKIAEAEYVIDAGKTQVPENSLTVVGFYPGAEDIVKIKGKFKLL